jgi:HEAT repeat protein
MLCKLLDNPGVTSPYYILSPLKAAADPQAIPHVRPMLKHKSKQVRGQAARALAAMKDIDSFDRIAALIEDPPNPKDVTGYTLQVAKSLFELDPVRARLIIKQIESNPGNAGIHHFIPGY